jgi:hypothetical protein
MFFTAAFAVVTFFQTGGFMKLGKLALVLGSASAFVFAVACSSSSGDDSTAPGADGGGSDATQGGGDSGPPVDSGPGACTPLGDGTYAIAYTGPDGGIGCPPSNTTITIGGGDGGDAGGLPSGCTLTTDSTTCATTLACSITTAGDTDVINEVVTPSSDGTSATGTYSTSLTGADGGTLSSCTGVTFTYTKQ